MKKMHIVLMLVLYVMLNVFPITTAYAENGNVANIEDCIQESYWIQKILEKDDFTAEGDNQFVEIHNSNGSIAVFIYGEDSSEGRHDNVAAFYDKETGCDFLVHDNAKAIDFVYDMFEKFGISPDNVISSEGKIIMTNLMNEVKDLSLL